MTTRRLMLATAAVAAVLAIPLGLSRRREAFRIKAACYARRASEEILRAHAVAYSTSFGPSAREMELRDEHFRLSDYYEDLKLGYERAARYPWLPVASDPPAPR